MCQHLCCFFCPVLPASVCLWPTYPHASPVLNHPPPGVFKPDSPIFLCQTIFHESVECAVDRVCASAFLAS